MSQPQSQLQLHLNSNLNLNSQNHSQLQFEHSQPDSQTHSHADINTQLIITSQSNPDSQNDIIESNGNYFELAKLVNLLQQMDMIYPVASCLTAIVALIFGIYWITSMYGDSFSSIMGLRLFSGRWIGSPIYIWSLINTEINFNLVIFAFGFFCFFSCFYFYFLKHFSIDNFCHKRCPVIVAAGIGIG